jgi:hypothetical protein
MIASTSETSIRNLSGSDLSNVDKNDVTEALAFHSRITGSVEKNPKYETFAIKGIDQPTSHLTAKEA